MAAKKCAAYVIGYWRKGPRYYVCTGEKHVKVDYDDDIDQVCYARIIGSCDGIVCKAPKPFTPNHIKFAAFTAKW